MSFTLEVNKTKRLFNVQFQPIVELETNNIIALEALSREVSNKEANIETALQQIASEGKSRAFTIALVNKINSLCQYFPSTVRYLSINVTMEDMSSLRLCGDLEELICTLSKQKIRLVIELPEAQKYPLPNSKAGQALSNNLKILRMLGILIAIDDFGEGYHASETIVHDLMPNVIKIDKKAIQDPAKNLTIWQAVESIKQSGNISIVAEGIENLKDLYFVIDKGIQFGQGYYLGRPRDLKTSNMT